jgi:hypothetical protein
MDRRILVLLKQLFLPGAGTAKVSLLLSDWVVRGGPCGCAGLGCRGRLGEGGGDTVGLGCIGSCASEAASATSS